MKIIILLLILLFSINLQAQKQWIKKGEYTFENPFGETIGFNLSEITCINDTLCFIQADGDLEYILFESRDAGNTWDEVFTQSIKSGEYLLSTPIKGNSTSENNHYFLTYDGLLLKTKDKGQSLSLIKLDEIEVIPNRTYRMDMLNDNVGFINNYLNDIWLTNDGWETFERVHLEDKLYLGLQMFFYNDTTLMFAGGTLQSEDRNLYKYYFTTDSLELVHTFVFGDEFMEDQNIFALDFTDQMNGNAVGSYNTGDGDKVMDLVYKTTDGGYNWKLIFEQVGNPPFHFNQLKFRDKNYGIAVGGWGKFLLTEDGGDTWDYMAPPDEEEFLPLFMRIDYAGEYPVVIANNEIYRLENITGLDEYITEGADINIRQTSSELLISIEDENFRRYKLQIVDIQGNIVQESNLSSGVGTFFKPYDISDLGSGVFFYRILTEGLNVRTGNFMVEK
jgi:photosystem II stability/assembly factor-like uncharacterized protein